MTDILGIFQKEWDMPHSLKNKDLTYMEKEVESEVCRCCPHISECKVIQNNELTSMIEEVLEEIEEYGLELSIAKGREFYKRCGEFTVLKEKVQRNLWELKKNQLWEERIRQSKKNALILMQLMAQSMEHATRELNESLFHDERLERKMRLHLKRAGIRAGNIHIFMLPKGQFEVQILAKAKGDMCIDVKQMSGIVSSVLGRNFAPDGKAPFVLNQEYSMINFVEKLQFQVLSGVERTSKKGSPCSGDNFLTCDIPGGKKVMVISDGMGSGTLAYEQSKVTLELIEKLLEGGVPVKDALEILNTTMVEEGKEVSFATLDLCIIDCYLGEIELYKAGAADTYVISAEESQCYEAASLPMGVFPEVKWNHYQFNINQESYIVMLTDGVMESVEKEKRKEIIETVMKESKTKNPKERATLILEKAMDVEAGEVKDDMTVAVLGVWSCNFHENSL